MKNSQKANSSIYIILFLLVVIVVMGFFLFNILKSNAKVEVAKKSEENSLQIKESEKVFVDTSTWKTFPDPHNYPGWTMKYPEKNKPIYVQSDVRIQFDEMDKERALMLFNLENGIQKDSLKQSAEKNMDYDKCDIDNNLVKTSINSLNVYKYSGRCDISNDPDTIMGKPYVKYYIEDPYETNLYLIVKIYSDPDKVTAIDKLTIEEILKSIDFEKPEPLVKEGYQKVSDIQNRFTLTYPENYRLVEDKAAWKNASVILYTGGQSYDLVVQVWNSESEYRGVYGNSYDDFITAKNFNGKYITFLNANKSKEVEEIIKSFEPIK